MMLMLTTVDSTLSASKYNLYNINDSLNIPQNRERTAELQ